MTPSLNDEIGALLDEETEERKSRLGTSIYLSSDSNPDGEATLQKISRRSGIPVEALRLDGGTEAKRRIAAEEMQILPAHAPRTAEFLSSHDNAAVAHDDWENLSLLEKAVSSVKSVPSALRETGRTIASAFETGQLQQQEGRLAYRQMTGDDSLETAGRMVYLGGEIERRQKAREGRNPLNILGGVEIAGQMWESGKKALGIGLASGMTAGGVAAIAGQAGPQVALPEEIVTVPAAFASAFGAGTAYGMLEDVRQVEAGQAFKELRETRGRNGEEITPGTAATAASVVGLVNAAIEGVGLKIVTAPVRRMLRREVMGAALKSAEEGLVQQTTGRAATRFGKDYIIGIGAETGQEISQELTNIVAAEISKATSAGEFDQATAGEVGQRLWDIAWQTASGMAWLGLVPAGAGFYSDAKAARQARQNQDVLASLGDAAQRTKLRERLPEKLAEFVDSLTVDGDVSTVFVPADRWQIFWQERGMNPAEVAEVVGVSGQELDEALVTGGDVAIPLSEYTAQIAGTEHHGELSRDLRLRIGDMTLREAEEFETARTETVNRLLAEADSYQDEEGEASEDSARKVFDDVLGQLLGVRDRATAEREATLAMSRARTRAARLGVDPWELYQENPTRIIGQLPEVLTKRPRVDLDFDPLLDRLRKGDIPGESDINGPSLVEFLREKGIQDQGGELSAMDAGRERKAFQKSLVRKKGLTLDRAREAAAEAGYLPSDSTVSDFLEAIRSELAGRPTYSPQSQNAKLADESLALNQLQDALGRVGIDLEKMSNEDVRKALEDQGALWQGDTAPVVSLTGEEVGKNITAENAVELARTYFKEHLQGSTVSRDDIGEVRITGKGWKKLRRGLTTDPLKVKLIPAIPAIIERGEYQGREGLIKERTDDVVAFHFFTAHVEVEGRIVEAGVSVAEDSFGNLFYNLNHDPEVLLAKRKAPLLPRSEARGAEPSSGSGEASFDQSMPNSEDGVNIAILGQKNGKRGFFRQADGHVEIGLLEKADLSTFIHESGHQWLEELRQDAARPDAPEQLRADWEAIKAWLGVDGETITVDHHEQFARGAEAYVMEGKAPSAELHGVFSRFMAWLKLIYKELLRLNVELTPEVRGVFDRLLATDEEIARAEALQGLQPLFATAEDAGMSERAFSAYQKTAVEAGERRRLALHKRIMTEVTREQKAWWKEEKARIRAEVEEEAKQEPVYRVVQVLTKGKTFEGEEAPVKLDRAALVTRYGEEMLKRLPKGSATEYVYAVEGGIHPDVAAEMFGFSSGDELVRRMIETPKMSRYVAAEADRRMKERHGDLMENIAARAEEAMTAVHNDQTGDVLRAELRAIRRKQREVKGFVDAVKEEAETELERERREREYERRYLEAEKKLAVAIERGAKEEELRRLREEVKKAREEERASRRQMRDSIPSIDSFRQAARIAISRKQVGMIDPELYARAERKAAKEAFDRAAKKDYAGAGEAKQRQLLNFYLYREAVKAKEDIGKALEGFKKIFRADEKISKGRNIDLVNAARAILGSYGIGPATDNPLSFLHQVQQYNPALYEDLQMSVDVAIQDAKPYKRLTTEEFFAVKDAVDNLMHLARREKVVEIDGRMVAVEDVVGELAEALENEGLGEDGKYATSGTGERVSLKFAGARAAMRRVEHWVDARDGGKMDGPFRRFIWQPVSEAADRYRLAKADYIARFRELFKPVEASLHTGEIAAPELGLQGSTFRNKAELLMALLHTGNRSNLEKLLVGRKWGFIAEDGGLDTSAWDVFMRRMWDEGTLTEADYRFAQSVWDLLEELKPQAQEAHRKMYGYYFSEITAEPVHTPWGTFRGGYVPAVTDPFRVQDQAVREDREALLNENQTAMFPTPARGFTKKRVDYNKPLSLDMHLLPSHIDKVLKFVHLASPVRDVAKIVTNRQFREVLDRFDPATGSDMLTPWLTRAVRQTVETRSTGWGGKLLDDVARGLRRRTGLQLMALNVANTIQQFTGFSLSLQKVKAGHLAGAMWHFFRHPFEVADMAAEKSAFMRDRLHGDTFRLMGEIDILLDDSKLKKVQDVSHQYGYVLQHIAQNMVDVTTWIGSYNQSIAEGSDEKTAVRAADSAVRETQGSFAPEDISRLEGGSPFVRLFTQFASYFNMQANLLGTQFHNIVAEFGFQGGSGRLFLLYVTGFMIPAVLSEIIMRLASGRLDDDDDGEYWDDLLTAFFGGQFKTGAAMVPGGQVVVSAANRFNMNPNDDRMSISPAVSALDSFGGTVYAAYKLAVEGEVNRRGVKDSLTLIGLVTGLPAGALARPLGYLTALERGDTEPENALDATRGFITGYAPKQ